MLAVKTCLRNNDQKLTQALDFKTLYLNKIHQKILEYWRCGSNFFCNLKPIFLLYSLFWNVLYCIYR